MKATVHPKNIEGTTGNILYLVVGRIPGDDDDAASLIRASSSAAAEEIFRHSLVDDAGLPDEQIQHITEEHGDICYVTSLFEVGEVHDDEEST